MTPYLHSDAWLSSDGIYRYWLSRQMTSGERAVSFIGLNPSTADALKDDPTIRRCVGFARAWGFDKLYMGNLYAWRATNPQNLPRGAVAIGTQNKKSLESLICWSEIQVLAWGAYKLSEEAKQLAAWLKSIPTARCLGTTKAGAPKHPLYLPSTTELMGTGELKI